MVELCELTALHDEIMRKQNNMQKQSGFTLVEAIVAMLVVAMMIIGLVPLYSFIQIGNIKNITKVVATNLAQSRLEAVRSMPWNQIGTIGGNPSSTYFLHDQDVTYPNSCITYHVTTTVWWARDPSRSDTDVIQTDYKDIYVEVTAKNGLQIYQDIKLYSRASMEGEEQDLPGSNIIVYTYKGWNTDPNPDLNPIPVGNINLHLAGPVTYDMPTDVYTGGVIFAGLSAGSYTPSVNLSGSGMIEFPGDSNSNMNVTVTSTDNTTIKKIHVETPCHLAINFNYLQLANGISTYSQVDSGFSGTVTLTWPSDFGYTGSLASKTYTVSGPYGGSGPAYTIGDDLWPVGDGWHDSYGLQVAAPGYYSYNISSPVLPLPDWDGTFSGPGENKQVPLKLVPLPQVKVVSAGTNISGATVNVYLDTHTYHSGAWDTAPAQGELMATGTTDSNGSVVFNATTPYSLTPNSLPPASASEGSIYTTYGIQVSKALYTTAIYNDAFWINSYGLEMQCGSQADGTKQSSTTLTIYTAQL
ncbi:MAG: type II secretion system protein [Thermacetogeniaceae bacterium]